MRLRPGALYVRDRAGYDTGAMPYLRLSSLPLDDAAKRHLADELTATVLDILPDQKPEWTTVHFTSFDPGDFAIAGRLVSEGAVPETHLELSAPGVDEKSWFALRNRLTDVIVEALGIPDGDRWHVNVKLNAYDPHTFAVAGNAADEIDGDGHLGEPEPDEAGTGGRWLRSAAFVGFGLGMLFGYRWLADRLRGDEAVDILPPLDDVHGDLAGSHGAHDAREDAAPAREY